MCWTLGLKVLDDYTKNSPFLRVTILWPSCIFPSPLLTSFKSFISNFLPIETHSGTKKQFKVHNVLTVERFIRFCYSMVRLFCQNLAVIFFISSFCFFSFIPLFPFISLTFFSFYPSLPHSSLSLTFLFFS